MFFNKFFVYLPHISVLAEIKIYKPNTNHKNTTPYGNNTYPTILFSRCIAEAVRRRLFNENKIIILYRKENSNIMKKKKLFLIIPFLFLVMGMMSGCEKDEALPHYEAKGRVLGTTTGCYGHAVYIEVENPKGIGRKGSFSDAGWEYENAISVPYFDKVNLPTELMKEGTWLHFEYREMTEEDGKRGLFVQDNPPFCPFFYGPPAAEVYIITRIIKHK